MFENRQVEGFFDTSLDYLFKTDTDDLFNYKKTSPITYKRKEWIKIEKEKIIKGYFSKKINDISDWNVSGNAGWQKVNDGDDFYFMNKDITDSQSAIIYKTFNDVTHIEFDYKVSSEHYYDFLTVYINGGQAINVSGEVDWTHFSKDFDEPTNVEVKFNYHKDSSDSAGNDSGYIKNLKITQFLEQTNIIINYKKETFNGINIKSKIKTNYKNVKNNFIYSIINYSNIKNNAKYKIIPYLEKVESIKYPIIPYNNIQNYVFYRVSYDNPPPKRIIIKDLDDN